MKEIKLKEFNYVECDNPFIVIEFVDKDNYKIVFTLHGEKVDMYVDDSVTLEAVEEAIAIVKSRKLEF